MLIRFLASVWGGTAAREPPGVLLQRHGVGSLMPGGGIDACPRCNSEVVTKDGYGAAKLQSCYPARS